MNDKSNFDVLLTNGWDRVSYNVLRRLAKSGLRVAFGVDKYSGMGVYSNLIHRNFTYTAYNDSEDKFISDVVNFIKKNNINVYIPTGEEIIIVAKHIDKFKDLNTRIPISHYTTLSKLHYKSESYHLAKSLNIPIPETIIPNSFEDIKDFGDSVGYPLVFKNFFSTSAKGVFYLFEERLHETIDELLYKQSLNFGEFLIQQFVHGEGYGVSMLLNKGKVIASFTHKRLREKKNTGGPSTLRVSTKNDVLEKYAKIILTSQNFTGIAMVEFRFNEEKQQSWFIEVNPRFWGSVGLAINSGVDFPNMLYDLAIGKEIKFNGNYSLGIKYKWLLGDIYVNCKNFIKTFKFTYIKNIFEKVDGFDDFYSDDKLPFFMLIFLYVRRSFKGYYKIKKK